MQLILLIKMIIRILLIRTGAFKKLSDTSNINFNLGKNYILDKIMIKLKKRI